MRKAAIFGNSGSGKSTLGRQLRDQGLPHLDLDSLAWLLTCPPERRPREQDKYESREIQDRNLPMLLDWIAGYTERDDSLLHGA